MKRTLSIAAVSLLLTGCAGKLGTMAYIPHGEQATLTVGPPAPVAAAGAKPAK